MILYIRDEAELELEQAYDYYEQRRTGLGQEFLDEYIRGTHKIIEAPFRWPKDPVRRDIHRYRLNRFPYTLVYRVHGDDGTIIAVANLKRRPGYWRDRLNP